MSGFFQSAKYAFGVAFDEELADRVRVVLEDVPGVTEKRMFGGLAFLIHGHMSVAASGQGGLLVRIDPTERAALLRSAYAEPMIMRGKPMDGWLRVDIGGLNTKRALSSWVKRGVTCATALAVKQ